MDHSTSALTVRPVIATAARQSNTVGDRVMGCLSAGSTRHSSPVMCDFLASGGCRCPAAEPGSVGWLMCGLWAAAGSGLSPRPSRLDAFLDKVGYSLGRAQRWAHGRRLPVQLPAPCSFRDRFGAGRQVAHRLLARHQSAPKGLFAARVGIVLDVQPLFVPSAKPEREVSNTRKVEK